MLINLETKEILSEYAFKIKFWNVSFPSVIDDAVAKPFGYEILREGIKPDITDPWSQQIVELEPIRLHGHWTRNWQIETINHTDEENAQHASEVKKAEMQVFSDAVQSRLDNFAKTKNYDNIFTASTYANSTNEKFAREGKRCVELRDSTWAKCYAYLADVESGNIINPTVEDLLSKLPKLTWE